MSTVRVRLHGNSSTASSGTTADSTNRHLETQLIAFSPISNTLSTISSTDSSSRPLRGLLDSTYSIDSTHIEAIQHNEAASWNYDPTAEEYYYGFGCTIVSTGAKIPIAAEFTQTKRADQETAMRVTCDALAVDTPIWMLGDSAYDILDWHDHLLAAGVVPIAPYNPRNTDDPKNIEYRVEDRIEEHSEDIQLKQSILDETYNNRTGVERTNDAVKDCGLGHVRARGRVHARTEVFVTLCLRLVVAITNYERGSNPGCEKL